MKNWLKTKTLAALFGCALMNFLISGCDKPTPPAPTPVNPVEAGATGVYVLCEGVWQMNNSTLAFYDFAQGNIDADIFLTANGRGLGDTGSDLQIYGGKMYCVVNLSETVEVMTPDAHSIKQISLPGKQPRKVAFYQGFAYVSCYDGDILKIDTATLNIVATQQAGSNPDGLCVANGKLYVANSGGLNHPNYGNTISVIDAATMRVLKEIEVTINPTHVAADNFGDVYVISNGNYNDIASSLQRISSQTDELVQTFNFPATNFAICGDFAYIYYYDYSMQQSQIKVLNVFDETIAKDNFIVDGTDIQTPYAIAVNPANGDVYISDAYKFTTNGDVYCFGADGRKKFQFEAGVNPAAVVVINN